MIKRRAFFGKLAGLLGLATLPVRSDAMVKSAESEPIDVKKGTVTVLQNGWVVRQYSYQRYH